MVKVADELALQWSSLPASTAVGCELSVNEGVSWYSLGTGSASGSTGTVFAAGYEAGSTQVRLTLSGDGTSGPEVRSTSLKVHPLTISDVVVELPVNCGNRLEGLNGVEIEGQVSSIERIRRLEALAGTRVLFQDTDWPVTPVTVWEMVSVESTTVGIYDRSKGHRTESNAVAVVTLRRAS